MVEVASLFNTKASSVASDIQTAVVLVTPEEFTQNPCHLGSLGLVEEVKTAKSVVGDDAGLLFSAFPKLSVDVVAPLKVGAPGILAKVYAEELAEAVPVLGVGVTESLAWIL